MSRENRVDRMTRLYNKGQSLRAIAAQYHVTHVAVRYALLKVGVELRGRGRPAKVKS
jgi:hypothetical protein